MIQAGGYYLDNQGDAMFMLRYEDPFPYLRRAYTRAIPTKTPFVVQTRARRGAVKDDGYHGVYVHAILLDTH